MSTISGRPGSRTVRRRIRSGFEASEEPAGGVIHPSTQVADGSPLVGGGGWGNAGGVGDACVGVEGNGDGDGDGDGVKKTGSRPSHAARSTSATTIMRFFVR
jgi:hypothetical protein